MVIVENTTGVMDHRESNPFYPTRVRVKEEPQVLLYCLNCLHCFDILRVKYGCISLKIKPRIHS